MEINKKGELSDEGSRVSRLDGLLQKQEILMDVVIQLSDTICFIMEHTPSEEVVRRIEESTTSLRESLYKYRAINIK